MTLVWQTNVSASGEHIITMDALGDSRSPATGIDDLLQHRPISQDGGRSGRA
jgi:hypothetical protein